MMLHSISNALEVETENDDQATGVEIVRKALSSPLFTMAHNSGLSRAQVLSLLKDVSSEEEGLNFATGEITNLFEAGIIDPAKVTRCALQNAASVAGTLITTNSAIIQVDRD